MRPLNLQEMAAAMGGKVRGQVRFPRVTSVSADTRTLQKDALFVALRGEHFDGHDFVEEALRRGATAAVVDRSFSADLSDGRERQDHDGRLIEVEDTRIALGRLAGWYRNQLAAQVIAVVGSNGKTTTKNLIAAVLGAKMPGRAAPASFNNAVGVPLTLLSAEPADEFVVVEIGTNHPGEIAGLARIVRPDLAVVTSIGEEHLAYLGDVGGVAREEFSFISSMRGRAFVALSEQAAGFAGKQWRNGGVTDTSRCSLLTYGFDEKADLRAGDLRQIRDGQRFRVNGRFDYALPLLGRHNVLNALGAIAIGTRMRLSHGEIAEALAGVQAPAMRLQRMTVGPITVINDAYNANPDSTRAAIEAVDALPDLGRRVLILGDMRELGDHAERCHRQVGHKAGQSTAQVVVSVGAHARTVADGVTAMAGTTKRIYACPSVEALGRKLPMLLEPGDIVLLKASRSVRLERIMPIIEGSVGHTMT